MAKKTAATKPNSPELESELLARLLTHWALDSTLKGASQCANLRSIQS